MILRGTKGFGDLGRQRQGKIEQSRGPSPEGRSCPGAKGTESGLGAFRHFAHSVSVRFAGADIF